MKGFAGVGFVACIALVACKPMGGGGQDAGPPPSIAVSVKPPMPASPGGDFAVGDEVLCLGDDGALELEAKVEAVGGPLVYLDEKQGWVLETEAKGATTGKRAERGFQLYMGSGRFAKKRWLPAAQVFAPYWVTTAKVGDTVYEQRFGNFEPYRCTVTELPATKNGSLRASCEGQKAPRLLDRKSVVASIRAPQAASELKPGDIVYVNKTTYAMVMGTQDDRILVREAGFGSRDKAVLLSTVEHTR